MPATEKKKYVCIQYVSSFISNIIWVYSAGKKYTGNVSHELKRQVDAATSI